MTVNQYIMFVFGDRYKSNLISCVQVEVHARQVIYTKAKVGF
jgi:hypothetical protein